MTERIKYYLLLGCLLLLLAPKPVFAQSFDEGYGRRSGRHHYNKNYNSDDSATKYNIPENDCSKYYFRSIDTLNHLYKKVTITTYACDSNLNIGSNMQNEVITYNAKGEKLKDITKRGRKVVAKIKIKYDKNYRYKKEVDYDTTDLGTLFKAEIMKKAYTAKGLQTLDYDKDRSGLDFFTWAFWKWDWDLFDPTIDVTAEKWNYDNKDRIIMHYNLENDRVLFIGDRDITRELYQYDSSTNVTSDIKYHREGWLDGGDKDTNFTFSGYKKGQIVYEIDKPTYGNITRSYYTYDNKGNEIFNATTGYDSITNITQYDSAGRFAGSQKYRNGKLTDSYSVKFDKNRNRIENEEKISTATENACANNIVTTTVTDSNGFEVSKVETKIENAKPFVTTTSHNYIFHKGMIFSDTCSMVEEGHFYAMTSQRVIKNEYDSHDNQTSYYEESGGTYSTNFKWKKQFDEYNNVIYDADFNACNDYLPERETRMEYYPGGKMVKKETDDNGYARVVTYYDETGRIQKVLYLPTACGTGGYYNNSNYGYGDDGKIYHVDVYSYE